MAEQSNARIKLGLIAALVLVVSIVIAVNRGSNDSALPESVGGDATSVPGGSGVPATESRAVPHQASDARPLTATQVSILLAGNLYREFMSNEVRAESKYAGRMLTVAGRINNISGGEFARVTISDSILAPGVACYFADGRELARRSSREMLVVSGNYGGFNGLVVLKNCVRLDSSICSVQKCE